MMELMLARQTSFLICVFSFVASCDLHRLWAYTGLHVDEGRSRRVLITGRSSKSIGDFNTSLVDSLLYQCSAPHRELQRTENL